MSTFADNDVPDEMQHNDDFIRVCTVCKGNKRFSEKIIHFFLF